MSLRSLCHGLTRHRCKHMQARSFHGYLASPLSVVTRTRFVTSLKLKIRRNIPGVGLPWPACWSRCVHPGSLARCKCRGCTVSQPDPSNKDTCISGFLEERSATRTYDGRNDRRSRRGGSSRCKCCRAIHRADWRVRVAVEGSFSRLGSEFRATAFPTSPALCISSQ